MSKLTRDMLLEAAGRVYFARGEEYFELGYVQAVRERDGIIRATVNGTQPYKVGLMLSNGIVDGNCTCPLGQDREFCKHLVATGLAYIEQQGSTKKANKKTKPITPKDVEVYLSEMDAPELVRIIMEQADIDDEFYSMLKLRVAAERAGADSSEMRRVLRQAMTIHDFVSWRETGTYIRGIDRVLDQLRTMLTPKHAAQVIELVEYGMALWEENIGQIDDSDGCMGILRDDLHRLHLEACTIASPDRVALAERLAERTIESKWEMFYGAYEAYRDIFGKAGCARYREIVETAWNALPRMAPGEDDSVWRGRAFTLDHMMLSIADGEGDLDLAIRVMSRDLSHAYSYLCIAERCQKARRYKLALEWAEKGMAAFPKNTDSRLRGFLAEAYVRAKRPEDAMAMVWANFEQRATLETYEALAKCARKLKCWEFWREKALVSTRATIRRLQAEFQSKFGEDQASQRITYQRSMPQAPDHSLLVEIFLWEEQEEEAWAEAQRGGCSARLWLDLAKRREKAHPEDAIRIYQEQVGPLVSQTNNRVYQEAVAFMDKVHGLMKVLGQDEAFRAWVQGVKTENKRKRNFIKYVERRAWGK